MGWIFAQRTGRMYHDGELFAVGYSGRYMGKNNPLMQNVKETGPLPVGIYRIEDAYTHPHLGPLTMNLKPDPANEMFDRSEFRIHGDSIESPGFASKGCIVLNHGYRMAINDAARSGDRLLEVVEDYRVREGLIT